MGGIKALLVLIIMASIGVALITISTLALTGCDTGPDMGQLWQQHEQYMQLEGSACAAGIQIGCLKYAQGIVDEQAMMNLAIAKSGGGESTPNYPVGTTCSGFGRTVNCLNY